MCSSVAAESPADVAPQAVEWAREYLNEIRGRAHTYFRDIDIDTDVALAMVFPELVRYNLIRDRIETTGLKLFYTRFGGRFADFSIGPFQMKPSFAEALEETPQALLLGIDDFTASPDDAVAIREERVRRLESQDWQLIYLVTVALHLHDRFPSLAGAEQVARFAVAYNAGFWLPVNEFSKWFDEPVFPFGYGDRRNTHSYVELALWFYEQVEDRDDNG